ncbi:hypothetical protein JMJ77_0009356 [Colletotrichum scovillei]|uniref:Uncharacterized protein n=1 Tax=Colletotrichum scovillei TaxID=1209932 RepID=A0A9P7QY39_9PEZI|nr:hypothetical protein JMJ77_0009356 [Colletotrichum scovillei]KAG7052435.1 hypothetical protein JMJ78_0005452 [Colletotrichum scovillei]KAG7064724.1 hypothetical protein JMJ76_0012483 [Colletotrichum scovillei]
MPSRTRLRFDLTCRLICQINKRAFNIVFPLEKGARRRPMHLAYSRIRCHRCQALDNALMKSELAVDAATTPMCPEAMKRHFHESNCLP